MTSQGVLLLETGPWNQGQGVLVLEHVLQLETIRYMIETKNIALFYIFSKQHNENKH